MSNHVIIQKFGDKCNECDDNLVFDTLDCIGHTWTMTVVKLEEMMFGGTMPADEVLKLKATASESFGGILQWCMDNKKTLLCTIVKIYLMQGTIVYNYYIKNTLQI